LQETRSCPICRENADEGKIKVNREFEAVAASYKQARAMLVKLACQANEFQQELDKEKTRLRKQYAAMEQTRQSILSSTMEQPTQSKQQPSQSIKNEESTEAPASTTNVECPACGKFVVYKLLNKHLDKDCAEEMDVKPPVKSFFKPAQKEKNRKKIVAKVYDLLKDTQIRDLARSYSLSTDGNRTVLIRRVKEFVTRHNANIDSANPKSNSEIRREVIEWERRLDRPAPTIAHDPNTSNSQEAQQHIAKHRDQFDELIAQARRTAKRNWDESEAESVSAQSAHSTTDMSPSSHQ